MCNHDRNSWCSLSGSLATDWGGWRRSDVWPCAKAGITWTLQMTIEGSRKLKAPDPSRLAFRNPMRCSLCAFHPALNETSLPNHRTQRKLICCFSDEVDFGPLWTISTWKIPITLAYQYGWASTSSFRSSCESNITSGCVRGLTESCWHCKSCVV